MERRFLTLLAVAALGLSGCFEKAASSVSAPLSFPAGGGEKPAITKPAVLQGIKVVVDETGIAHPKNYYLRNQEGITNQQLQLKTSVPLTDLNLYKQGTKEEIIKLKEVGKNTYGIGDINLNKIKNGETISLENRIGEEVFNQSQISKITSDKNKEEKLGFRCGTNGRELFCND